MAEVEKKVGMAAPGALMDDDTLDRRDNERGPIELKVEYKRLNAFFADYTKNISRGGTFIQTTKPLPVGTEFVFTLTVPTLTDGLNLHGQVVWIVSPEEEGHPPGMGIQFIYRTEDEREQVHKSVESLMIATLGEFMYQKLMSVTDEVLPEDEQSATAVEAGASEPSVPTKESDPV